MWWPSIVQRQYVGLAGPEIVDVGCRNGPSRCPNHDITWGLSPAICSPTTAANVRTLRAPSLYIQCRPFPTRPEHWCSIHSTYICIYIIYRALDYRARYARTQITRLQSLSWKNRTCRSLGESPLVEKCQTGPGAEGLGATSGGKSADPSGGVCEA